MTNELPSDVPPYGWHKLFDFDRPTSLIKKPNNQLPMNNPKVKNVMVLDGRYSFENEYHNAYFYNPIPEKILRMIWNKIPKGFLWYPRYTDQRCMSHTLNES